MQERLAGADVGGDDRAAARIDVEERRLPAAHRLAGGAFEDELLLQQVVDDEGHGAAADAHGPREVGARNRLMGPDEIEDDLAVDFAAGAASRDVEAGGVDSPH